MNVKAIMCDIDGTLLSSDGVVTPKTVEMIKKAREQRILLQEKAEHLEASITIDKPYTNFGKSIATSSDAITIGQFAKVWALIFPLVLPTEILSTHFLYSFEIV